MAAEKAARRAWIRALEAVAVMAREPGLTIAGMLDELGRAHGDRPALLFADRAGQTFETMTYAELVRAANRVAAWAAAHGRVIGLMMPNHPAAVAIWLGLTRAGRVVALLNPNLSGAVLRHSLAAASCDLVIADDTLLAPLQELDLAFPLWSRSQLQAALGDAEIDDPLPAPADTALLVFTSGTTGLPKAARLSHGRVLEWGLWFAGMMDVQTEDRVYDCLPLYHSTGGVVAIAAALVRGASVLIAPGFSAGRFWEEVTDGSCTIFFYIGELCRYLLQGQAPPREHKLRLACGNGLHGSVWERFQQRFGLPHILEFYAATEGNISLYNCEGRPGAIGRVPPFLQQRFPLALIRVDASGAPVRGSDGHCIACDIDATGEAIGRVDLERRFDGYTDAEATARKLLHDVFAAGDCWFRSGDLMRRDAAGFYYFVDRMGDTFRWKGENVSTGEVAAVVRACNGVQDAVVYGVAVPGHEGRAGMAAVIAADDFNLAALYRHIAADLPSYAQPLFVRLCPALEVTGTFKLSATRLTQEGFADCDDPVWFNDRTAGAYAPLTPLLADAIAQQAVRT